ncbi:MAG TPA: helix-hairpin-helix domain-containing protein [candidate division Zixibacteria bacterium]|nr:helix-hairpin-helix domain-containing protein [candidate division Zixibacteria bacterium]
MINFTPQERKALLFLVMVLVVGSGITLYKKYHSDFAPELILKPKSNAVESNLSQPNLNLVVDTSTNLLKEASPPRLSEEKIRQVNLNSATQDDLESLPSIGPVLAKRIIEYRNQQGGFKSIEEIKKVHGIGNKIFEKIKDYIRVN